MDSAQLNAAHRQLQQASQLFWVYFSTLESMCIARYQWHNLPPSVQSDDIERLLYQLGSCSIAAMSDENGQPIPAMTYVLPYANVGMPDVYGYPIKWRTVANPPAVNYEANQQTGTICFTSLSAVRMGFAPDFLKCLEFAGELEDIALARRINRNATKTPYILKVPRQLEKTARAILNKIESNQNVLAVDDVSELVKIEVLKTDVPFLTAEYSEDEKNIWDRAFTSLGISSLPFKRERMIEDEVLSQDESTNLVELANLKERRRAAAHLNTLYGWDISVTPSSVPLPPNYQDIMGDTVESESEATQL